MFDHEEFLVYLPSTSRHSRMTKNHYKVFIFDSVDSMHRFGAELHELTGWTVNPKYFNYNGYCLGWGRVINRGKLGTEVGQIHFSVDKVGGGVVAHECAHATTYYLSKLHRKTIGAMFDDNCRDNVHKRMDEMYAWFLGYLVSQFWDNWWRLGKEGRIIKASVAGSRLRKVKK